METCILTVLGINFEEKYGFGKVLILIVFGHWAKTFCPESNMLLAVKWKFQSIFGEDHFWGSHFQKKGVNHIFSGVWAKNCQTPDNTFPAELYKLQFTIPDEQCGWIPFLKFFFQPIVFLGFEKKVQQF